MKLEEFETVYNQDRGTIKDKEKLENDLIKILGKENVLSDELDLFAYTKDSTLIGFNWILEGKIAARPDFVALPDNEEQIIQILKLANQEKVPVVPYGEGSGVVGGAIPVRGGIIIDMKKFNSIIAIKATRLRWRS